MIAAAIFHYSSFKDINKAKKPKNVDLTSDLLLVSKRMCFHLQTDIYFCSAVCCAVALPHEEPEACRRQKIQAALPHAARQTHKFAKRS